MKKATVRNIINTDSSEEKLTDEKLIIAIRAEPSKMKQDRIFNQFLFNVHAAQKHSWDVTIRRYIRWRMKQSRAGFGVYDESDLYQRCVFSFYKAVYKKFELDRGVKFSTYIYTAIEKTINRVSCELRKKKRTIGFEGPDVTKVKSTGSSSFKTEGMEEEGKISDLKGGTKIKVLRHSKSSSLVKMHKGPSFWVDSASIENVKNEIRVSPRYFTDSIHKPYCDNSKMCLGDILPDDTDDILPENQAFIVDAIKEKCKDRLSEMQFDIFFNGEVYKTTTVRDLAKKYNKSEPTISAIKKRKIIPVLKEIRSEVLKEFKCVRF